MRIYMELENIYGTIETLCGEHDKLYLLTESCHDGICEIQSDGTFIRANPAFCEIMDIRDRDYRKMTIFDLFKSAKLKKGLGELFSGQKKELADSIEVTVKPKIRKFIDVKMIAVPHQGTYHVLGIIFDKTGVTVALSNRDQYINLLHNLIRDMKVERKDTVYHLAVLAEVSDPSTASHLKRLEQYTRALATGYLGRFGDQGGYITETYIDDLAVSSILHDVGKVGISESILMKPGKLTEEEFRIVKQHTVIVADALKAFKGRKDILSLGREIANSHHEKWDGTGYPHGLKGEKIPFSARIIALCDVYDAIRSLRPYKKSLSHEITCEVVKSESGKAFDPKIVEVFAAVAPRFKEISMKYKDE
jgi:HD-GYP domain-containing protein (c-di-GMP phosphodiesterase class II)